MKKIIAILLALVMVLGLAGCTNGKCTYKLGDIYSLSNVLKDVPYKLGYWDNGNWIENRFIRTVADVAAVEQSEAIVLKNPQEGVSKAFTINYYFVNKSVSELNTIANSYFNKLIENEYVVAYDYLFNDDGGLEYGLIMNPNSKSDMVYVAHFAATTYQSNHPYIYVEMWKTDSETAYEWMNPGAILIDEPIGILTDLH